ncbi:MAG: M20/M25/M40 family metallo-hydrolase, partial [Chloroflexi bacterium]|nr:M20/M25/M40 family metallo-hydrolase [Chloroflexota bacterium]
GLRRGVLIALVLALIVTEAGLLGVAWQITSGSLSPRERAGVRVSQGEREKETLTPGQGRSQGEREEPTATPVSTPDVQPVVRQPVSLVSDGDFAAVASLFDVEQAMTFVEELTAPEFAGREAGSPGGRAAAEYVADRFAEYGLQPAGTEGFFQPFQAPYAEVMAVPTLSITDGAGGVHEDLRFREDYGFVWGGYAGGGVAQGRVFWVNDGSRDDYLGLDVTGQIVLCKPERTDEAIRQAVEHRAGGLLLLTDYAPDIARRRTYRQPPYLPESLPTLWISSTVANALLVGSDYTLSDLSLLFESVELPASARFEVTMNEPGTAEARNVLGVLPGADPAARDRVLILGAHYDHVGLDPNGDLYAGANDDASGVAVLLEIARLWQEAGFVPDCTVLFAAWDAEELGLLGSTHYVEHPVYPLESTIGMIQLDMVGLASEGNLSVDGLGNAVGRQLAASARLFDVPTEPVEMSGGSDHGPFVRAQVPAALLIWDGADVPYYHTPQDTVETLQPERLRDVGLLTTHAAMALTNVAHQLENVLLQQVAAMRAGDVASYRATLDPKDAELQAAAEDWLLSRSLEARDTLTVTIRAWGVEGDMAWADVAFSALDEQQRTAVLASYPARFVRQGADWRATWPVGQVLTTTHLTAGVVSPAEEDAVRLQALDAAYGRLAPMLGLHPVEPAQVTVYPDRQTLAWLAGTPDAAGNVQIPATHLAFTTSMTETAVSLVLHEMGLPDGQGDWLREGLRAWVELGGPQIDSEPQVLAWTAALTNPVAAADLLAGAADAAASPSATWSLAREFMRAYGPDGLARFCATWGRTGSQQEAFAALGTSPDAFASAWEDTVLQPLMAARQGVQETLAQRQQAVLALDREQFLATVDDADPVFRLEEERWIDGLTQPPARYQLSGQVLGLDANGDALARLALEAITPDGFALRPTYIARFRQVDGRWLLTGPNWETESSEHFVLRWSADGANAADLLAAAEAAYAQVIADLGREPAGVMEIRLYEAAEQINASLPWSVPVWRMEEGPAGYWQPGESIKVVADTPIDVAQGVARRLTLQLLADMGIEQDWLREGVALYETLRACPTLAGGIKAQVVPALGKAQRFHMLYDWEQMPALSDLAIEDVTLFSGQSWFFVEQLTRRFGVEALPRFLAQVGGKADQQAALAAAFADATGMDFATWQAHWEDAVATGGVPSEWIQAAQNADPAAMQETVAHLAAPEYAGRLAGSPGAEAASEWIAAQMAAYGLQPAGEQGAFFRQVPASFAALTGMPALRFRHAPTGQELSLSYLTDFREVIGGNAGAGEAHAQVVWLPNGYQPAMQFAGRVVMKRQEGELDAEAAQAREHGAGGLILVQQYLTTRQRELGSADVLTETLPVALISQDTWTQVLKLAGLGVYEANNAPPALLMDLEVDLVLPLDLEHQAIARDVVGVLPGSQPDAEPLVIAAHYDGVGSLPDGTLYPGANKNASGVAVLLELARIWQRSGWQPERPIYFVAWGAEEADLASSRAYVEAPLVLIENTLAVFNLDGVGEARSYYLNMDPVMPGSDDVAFDFTLAGELLGRRVARGKYDGRNTHTVLQEQGIPVVQLFWPDGRHVHTPDDTPETLDEQKLATTAEVLALVTMMMAR